MTSHDHRAAEMSERRPGPECWAGDGPVDVDWAHPVHELGCGYSAGVEDRCGCDALVHPECCPECTL